MCLNPQQERHERMAIAPTSFAGAAAQQRAWQVRSERPLLDWETPNETPARTKLPNSAEDRRFESISLQRRVCPDPRRKQLRGPAGSDGELKLSAARNLADRRHVGDPEEACPIGFLISRRRCRPMSSRR